MFFRPKAARWLIDSGHKFVPAFKKIASETGSRNPDRDAAIMYCGIVHFAIAVFISNGKIKSGDIPAILNACAIHIRLDAPNYSLEVSYLEDTRLAVMRAVLSAERDPVRWTQQYFNEVFGLIEIDEWSFCGALSAHSLYVWNFDQ